MSRRLWLLPLLAFIPLVIGVIVSVAWQATGENRILTVDFIFAWLPTWIGAALTLALLPAAVLWLSIRGRANKKLDAALIAERDRHRRFLARLDHEMKNPIQGIRLAIADGPSAQQQRSIDTQARHLTRLLSDLRRLSEAELLVIEPTPLDPSELIAEAVMAAKELPGADQRSWDVSIPRAPRPLPEIRGDSDLLFFALSNLLANAVKYSEPNDRIEVRAIEEDDSVLIEIADTGIGIPPDEVETVWEELGRGREARGTEGSGLGLPFVRAIIERHKGSVEMRSLHGEGTAMVVRLPRH
ncbi:MAG: sensor histidine kinase [Gulosibacter sp.]|uniref:sensor histidine kinase n=1 Tax=Gulosibacter sp. TaxID=2817531 RepID=UPI003F937B71